MLESTVYKDVNEGIKPVLWRKFIVYSVRNMEKSVLMLSGKLWMDLGFKRWLVFKRIYK